VLDRDHTGGERRFVKGRVRRRRGELDTAFVELRAAVADELTSDRRTSSDPKRPP